MHKFYVLDTNVLLHSHTALESFADNTVVLPMTVIEELDRFKTKTDELGRNARAVTRYIARLREEEEAWAKNNGHIPAKLTEGIEHNKEGGKIMVMQDVRPDELQKSPDLPDIPDNHILRAALKLKQDNPDVPVIFVTKDLNLRIKASICGLEPQDWESGRIRSEEQYTGFRTWEVNQEQFDQFYKDKHLEVPGMDLLPNEFLVLSPYGGRNRAIARADGPSAVKTTRENWFKAYGIKARSDEQRMALNLLLDRDITLVTLVGGAGTGKTLLALAAGLEMLAVDDRRVEQGKEPVYVFEKILVTRPIIPMGKDIGFLPGSKDRKMSSWMQPVFDNLSFLMQNESEQSGGASAGGVMAAKAAERKVQKLLNDDILELEALTYIRGRSIARQYIVVDEAQNLTPHEVKTIVSRAGAGTKIVLTGDPDQIDNPYLDSMSNGLVHTVERMKGYGLFGHVTLKKSERSDLAAAAADSL